MKYLALIYIIWAFLKAWYYGIYELKETKNKTAATAMFLLAIVRSNFSNYNFIYIILNYFHINFGILIVFFVAFDLHSYDLQVQYLL